MPNASNSAKAVLLSYNHPELTRQSLASLFDHFSFEQIILVHNGSEKVHSESLISDFTKIEHLLMPENKGFSGGCNFGLQHAFQTTSWVYFFTNDTACIQLPNKLPKPGFYAPLIYRATHYYKEDRKIDSIGGYFIPKEKKLVHAKSKEEFKSAFELQGAIPYVPGSGFLIHKNFYETNSPFDETLHTYWEDVDFSARAFFKGHHPSVEPDFILTHKGGRTCRKNKFYTNHLFQRNREIVCSKYDFWGEQ